MVRSGREVERGRLAFNAQPAMLRKAQPRNATTAWLGRQHKPPVREEAYV